VISKFQLRAARALLGWSRAQVAHRAEIPLHVMGEIERRGGSNTSGALSKVLATFEAAGISFLTGSDGDGLMLQHDNVRDDKPTRREVEHAIAG
jgi:hypothetical protein